MDIDWINILVHIALEFLIIEVIYIKIKRRIIYRIV